MNSRQPLLRRIALVLATTVLTTLAVPASAKATLAWVCPKGSVCFYYDPGATRLACQTPSDGNPDCDGAWIWAIYNRGYTDPGQDHAYVSGNMAPKGAYSTGCIHVGHKKALARAWIPNWVIWSRECNTGLGEDWEL
ncbi:hypothetical protein [Nonomuraea soli]|uniref:YkuD domain-containing protein n=1 Tax=Nonomuraea soli TaxID=1032476 RepID=A0A7W0CV84_9ACTN|nr:hypothetical protein [Nonomuraea soli]MBA2897994.1 hypothetical protein [Nonomuraea soli]